MSKQILIVDDEPNIVISLEFLMKREGFAVTVARDGEEGLAAIRERHPDLVALIPVGAILREEYPRFVEYEDDIAKIYADEGPTLKRAKFAARGRYKPIRKRTSHVTVVVTER